MSDIKAFCNLHLYTDAEPFEVVRVVSAKTVDVRPMKAELDPTWKREVSVGGFCCHTSNNGTQRWIFASDPEAGLLRVRLGKRGWNSARGRHVMADHPVKFYDFNF